MLTALRELFGTSNKKTARDKLEPAEEVRSLASPKVVQSVIDPVPVAQPGPRHEGEPVPSYPKRGPAVPSVAPEKLLATQDALLRELRQASALSFVDFDEIIMPTIIEYARFVHLLPASEYDHHADLGGLFRHGLEVAFFASRRAESREFALNEVPSVRKFQIFRWRACALLGGMLHDAGKAVIDIGARSFESDTVWNPHVQSLWDWTQEHKVREYSISFRETRRHKEHDAVSVAVISRLLPERTMRWLGEYQGRMAYDAMLMALTGSDDRENPLVEIIHGADGDSVAKDRAESQKRLVSVGEGGSKSNAAILVRAIREKILQGQWRVNQAGNVVWHTANGIYLMYPHFLREVVEHLRKQGITHLPTEENTLLKLLGEAGIVASSMLASGMVVYVHQVVVYAPEKKSDLPLPIKIPTVKFNTDRIIPDYYDLPPAIDIDICDPDGNVVEKFTANKPVAPVAMVEDTASDETAVASSSPDIALGEAPEEPESQHIGSEADSTAVSNAHPSEHPEEASLNFMPEPFMDGEGHDDSVMSLDEYAPFSDEQGDDDFYEPALGGIPIDETGVMIPGADSPPLVDPQVKRNSRQEYIKESLKAHNNPFPPTSREGAVQWVEEQSDGAYLKYLISAAEEGVLQRDRDWVVFNDQLRFAFPESLEGCGTEPAEVVEAFSNHGWIEQDQVRKRWKRISTPMGNDTRTSFMFTYEMTQCLNLLLPRVKSDSSTETIFGPNIHGRNAMVYVESGGLANTVGIRVVAVALHEFLMARHEDLLGGLASLNSATVAAELRDFCKQHKALGVTGQKLAATLLKVPDNPVLNLSTEKSTKGALKQYVVNQTYEPGVDLNEIYGAASQLLQGN